MFSDASDKLSELQVLVGNDDWIMKSGGQGKAKKYGSKFSGGFLEFRDNHELTDVIVVGPDGVEHHLHMLLLAHHSEFFRRAFVSSFREARDRKITLGFSDPNGAWPVLVEYFYTEEVIITDENIMPLFAMSRELLIPKIQEYCSDFAQGSLECSNALSYLCQAVQLSCDGFRQTCVRLVAEGFPSSFNKPTDGLPIEVIEEILEFPTLNVQCEEQVLIFVLNYVKLHHLEHTTVIKLFSQVRFAYLANDTLARLSQEDLVPKEVLLKGMAARLALIDRPEKLAGMAVRSSYCCTIEYGLPGGSEYVLLPLESVWEDLVPHLTVQVSGSPEGDPESILRTFEDSTWFNVSSDGQGPVWVEVLFPACMHVVELSKYTFSHGMNLASHMFPYGISDSQWFSMKGLVTQVAQIASDNFVTLKGSESCARETEFTVTLDPPTAKSLTFRRMRICPADNPLGGDYASRLSIRRLRLFGKVEVSMLRDDVGQQLLALHRSRRGRGASKSSI